MEVHKLFTDDRAVSPVVGVALLIAVAVILAAVIGAVVLGLGTGGVETPQAQLQAEIVSDNAVVSHNGGEPLPADQTTFNYNDGTDSYTLANDLSAGESITLFDGTNGGSQTVSEGDTITVIWDDPNSDSETVIDELNL